MKTSELQSLLNELQSLLLAHGYHQKMKSFISSGGSGQTKYKFCKNSLQKFTKGDNGWIKLWSAYYKDISINPEGRMHMEKFI